MCVCVCLARKMFPKRKLNESSSPLGGRDAAAAAAAAVVVPGAPEEQKERSSEGALSQPSKRPRVESPSSGTGGT